MTTCWINIAHPSYALSRCNSQKSGLELGSQVRPAGTYDVRFERGSLPSGVYLVRLRAGGAAASRRVVID